MVQVLAGAVDIGNTRIKILVDGQFFAADFTSHWQEAMHKYLWNFSGKHLLLGVSSVNPEATAQLDVELKKRSNIRWSPLYAMLQEQTLIDTSGIQGIGSDRVLSLIGALDYNLRHSPALVAPLITIDCGTAITVNVVNVRRKCLGGAILPGITTQLRALHHFTQLLPEVEAAFEDASIGTNTAQAIRIGVVRGIAGALKEIVGRIIKHNCQQENPLVFITGGDALIVRKALEGWHLEPIYEPHLVLYGASALMAQR
ncbi:MAG: type III pantothenate kinase, partial [Bacteroidota bacterium]|nr:type III pantothenate kinase [Candidatus Kapabacteria bacterium]MDW8221278.1 type III pantothenate kinase [Bacteroidota bacterium]